MQLNSQPAMVPVLLKGFFKSLWHTAPVRPADFPDSSFALLLPNVLLHSESLRRFNVLCGFSSRINAVPATFFQTLFTPLLGKYITSPFFPAKPLGLIHTRQLITVYRPMAEQGKVDLKAALSSVETVEKGIACHFRLTASDGDRTVWEGISTFFSKTVSGPSHSKSRNTPLQEMADPLPYFKTISFPADAGRRYARVSLDYNLHHVSRIFARIFGFKRPIAHGMYTMSRCVAELVREGIVTDTPVIDAAFKRPVFLPATAHLGYTMTGDVVNFELKNPITGVPHLTGKIMAGI